MHVTATTPAQLAEELGCNERYLRALARRLGACHVIGKTMVLLPEDVATIMEEVRNPMDLRRELITRQQMRIEELEEKERQRGRIRWRALPPTESGYIYFILGDDAVKIGFARDPKRRLKQLQPSNPHELRLLAAKPAIFSQEADLHERFAEHRIAGEWFTLAPAIMAYIDEVNG